MSGATALAEGGRKFKVDVDLIFNNERGHGRKYILRTVFDDMGVWKAKYAEVGISPQEGSFKNQNKQFALVDGEVWVFRIDATNSADIIIAIQIAKKYYGVKAEVFLADIYIKNLNTENENEMSIKARVSANKSLYRKTCEAITTAAKVFAYRGELKLHVFSNSNNPKIRQTDLHDALLNGGAKNITTDPNTYQYLSSKNDNSQPTDLKPYFTHHHLAVFNF